MSQDYSSLPENLSKFVKAAIEDCAGRGQMILQIDHIAIHLLAEPDINAMLLKQKVDGTVLGNALAQQVLGNPNPNAYQVDHDEVYPSKQVVQAFKNLTIMDDQPTNIEIFNELLADKTSVLYAILDQSSKGLVEKIKTPPERLVDKYAVNLTELSRKGNIDPVIGRSEDIQTLAELLARKKKSNVILLGNAGVGKTSVVEGLANAIVDKTAPTVLQGREIYSIETASLLAGTKYRGEFEERAKNLLTEIAGDKKRPIIFLDEAHTVMNAGSSSGSGGVDLANIMKPMLARGELTFIGATTDEEYRKTIQKDAAMVRRLQVHTVNEPSPEDTKKIIQTLIPVYEKFHGVKYTIDADSIVEIGLKNIIRANPDKSIDIMDAVGAYSKANGFKTVTQNMLVTVVSKMTSIPAEALKTTDKSIFHGIEDRIKEKVFNQDTTVDGLVEHIMVAKAGIKEENKPIGSFLLVGTSGTGKTEITRQLSKELSIPLIKIDMSEYQEAHTVSKLIGSPPGYAGYDENSAKLVDDINKSPNCVLLLDEIEKAHPKVLSILLQIMDDAVLTSSHGKVARFNNVIIVMTSNLGAKEASRTALGFNTTIKGTTAVNDAVDDFFPPEFINRLSAVFHFNPLDRSAMHAIVRKEVGALNNLLVKQNVTVELTDLAVDYFADKAYDPKMGARPLQRLINTEIKVPLSRKIIYGEIVKGSVLIDYQDELLFL